MLTIFCFDTECVYTERFRNNIPVIFLKENDILAIQKDSMQIGIASICSNSYYINAQNKGLSLVPESIISDTLQFIYDGDNPIFTDNLLDIVTDRKYRIISILNREKPNVGDYKTGNYETIDGNIYRSMDMDEDCMYIINPKEYDYSFWNYYINKKKYPLSNKHDNYLIYDSSYNRLYNAKTFHEYAHK